MRAWDIFRQAYGTRLDQSQIINWIWYDTLTYTSAATTLLTFFNAVRATQNLGNMELAGALAHPKAFIVRAIRVHIRRETTLVTALPDASSDVQRLINNGFVNFTIGNKNYGTWMIHHLPGGSGAWASHAGAGGEAADEFVTAASNGVPDCRAVYALSQPLLIDPQINFQLQLQWTVAQTLTGNVDIEVDLDGELLRPVQ